jgi:hypothetical protein
MANTGNNWSGNTGTGGASGSGSGQAGGGGLGQSGAIRTWSGNTSGGSASDIVAASTDASSHVSDEEPEARVTAAGVVEEESAAAERPAQTAALSPATPTAMSEAGAVRGSGHSIGTSDGLDAGAGTNTNAGVEDVASSRWGLVILVLLVIAAAFAVRRVVQRGSAAGGASGTVRSTSGSRAQQAGLVIAPIRRTKTR